MIHKTAVVDRGHGACGAPAEPLPSRCLVVRPLSPGDIVLLPKAASSRLPRIRGAGVIWHQPNHPPLPCPRLCTITHPSRHRRITRRIVGAKGLAMGGTSCGLFSAPLRFLLCTAALSSLHRCAFFSAPLRLCPPDSSPACGGLTMTLTRRDAKPMSRSIPSGRVREDSGDTPCAPPKGPLPLRTPDDTAPSVPSGSAITH